MNYPFTVYQTKVEDHCFWVAESKDLKGCVGQGDTVEEALNELQQNETDWLDAAKEFDIPIPSPTITEPVKYSGKVTLRISPHTHERSHSISQEQGISLNQFFNDAIVSYIASIDKTPVQIISYVNESSSLKYSNGSYNGHYFGNVIFQPV